MISLLAASLYLFTSGAAQFVTPPGDLLSTIGNGISVRYKEVPNGVCETIEEVKSYSGYVNA